MRRILKQYWFLIGLTVVVAATLGDISGSLAALGKWIRNHHGPDVMIFVIFLASGLILNVEQIKAGLRDIQGILLALVLIFVVSPLIAYLMSLIPLATGVVAGLALVAVMPTTLSSGVVMTGAAGGNIAHALVITIVANALAVFTIPLTLSLMLTRMLGAGDIVIDKAAIMLKLGALVLVPLLIGLAIKVRLSLKFTPPAMGSLEARLGVFNQSLILCIVWVALAQSRETILDSGAAVVVILVLTAVFHGLLLMAAGGLVRFAGLGKGRRESVIFMGCQKTLPLSIILQVSLFPQYGEALAVCVLHHFLHLMMDGYLVEKLRR